MGYLASLRDLHEIPALEKTHFGGHKNVEHVLEGLLVGVIFDLASIFLFLTFVVFGKPHRTDMDQAERVDEIVRDCQVQFSEQLDLLLRFLQQVRR